MFCCDETITIIRCSNGTTYSAEVVEGCSWYTKAIGTVSDKGLMMARQLMVRIPEKRIPDTMPVIGDYVCRGAIDAPTSIKDLKGLEYGLIINVGDNRRGVQPHIALTAK